MSNHWSKTTVDDVWHMPREREASLRKQSNSQSCAINMFPLPSSVNKNKSLFNTVVHMTSIPSSSRKCANQMSCHNSHINYIVMMTTNILKRLQSKKRKILNWILMAKLSTMMIRLAMKTP